MKKLLLLFFLCLGSMLYAQNTDSVKSDEEQIFHPIEIVPEFPGGDTAMFKFLSDNILYPKDAKENTKQGRVVVQFVIEKDGSITNIVVVRAVYPSLDAEAVRVVGLMPKWKPGEQRGKPVRVKYTLPIVFRLN